MAGFVTQVGARIMQLRKLKGFDLRMLSRLTEISTEELAEIEAGKRAPGLVQLIRLSCSLDVLIKEISPECEVAEHSEAIRSVHVLLQSVARFESIQGAWWIDNACLLPADPREDCLGDPFAETDDALPNHAMGMIHLLVRRRLIEITWDVDRVKASSLAILSHLNSGSPGPRQILLHYYKSGWATELHPSLNAAMDRITTISSLAPAQLLAGTTVREVDMSALPPVDLFSHGLLAWRAEPTSKAFGGTWMADHAIAFRSDGPGLIYDWIGANAEAARFFGPAWRAAALGKPSDETLDDRVYDRQTSRAYRQVLESRIPRFEHVLASIDHGRREWTAYHRLMLPCEDVVISLARVVPLHEVEIPFLRRA